MAKSSNAARIRAYMASHPTAKPADIAVKFNVKPAYIYVLRSQMKKLDANTDSVHPEMKVAPTITVASASVPDMVNNPPHYTTGGVEVIDFIDAMGLDYHLGNVVKYVARSDKKGNVLEDLKKARWYLNRAIATREVALVNSDGPV